MSAGSVEHRCQDEADLKGGGTERLSRCQVPEPRSAGPASGEDGLSPGPENDHADRVAIDDRRAGRSTGFGIPEPKGPVSASRRRDPAGRVEGDRPDPALM